jgi:serine phosphatase RsbU (regulator of sigma subunit)/PAS domain-containing protein
MTGVESPQGYLRRLAQIDARVESARLDPVVVLERAAGLVAGRVGCRVEQAHAHLRQLAVEQDRDVVAVAADVLFALEGTPPVGGQRVRDAVERAVRGSRSTRARRRGAEQPPAEPADWVSIVQRVLEAVPGRHLVLMPVRDGAGEVEDYRFVAASPSVVDLAGRTGADLVGRRAGEIYPSVVDGPVWSAWREALADGMFRRIGPFPYVGQADARSTVELTLTVEVQPLGPALLNSWIRHDEDAHLADRIAQTERLGNLGWGEWDLVSDTIVWSDGLYRIYERDPALGPLKLDESGGLALPEDEPIRREATAAFGRGETVDLTYRIRVGDAVKYVRTVADAVRDSTGRPLRVFGIVQDVTTRETTRIRLAEVEQRLAEHERSLLAENRVAAQLQHIILPIPSEPIELPGLRVAVRYLPAEEASRVGGDWYHAATARDGSVHIVVGDVAGHGLQAATTMAQLRYAAAAVISTSPTSPEPASLLFYLNDLLYAATGPVTTATAVAVRYHPVTGELVWAQAGHPAPLLARAGRAAELAHPAGPLLGAMPTPAYADATTTMRADDVLVLYTDGLTENRARPSDRGLDDVIATLNRGTADGSDLPISEVLAQLHSANPADDTCVVAAQVLGPRAEVSP